MRRFLGGRGTIERAAYGLNAWMALVTMFQNSKVSRKNDLSN